MLSLSVGGAIIPTFNNVTSIYAEDFTYGGDEEPNCDTEESSKSSSDLKSSGGEAAGDWTDPSSEKYKIAQTLFNVLTKDYGLSGVSAAGWIGNVHAESYFTVDRREDENNQNYSERGYGLFQFTPGEKYFKQWADYKKDLPLEEEIKQQVKFIFESEINNGKYKSYLPNAATWFGLSGVDSLEDMLDAKDPETAMLVFFSVYERGDVRQMHRERRLDAANKANAMFNKDNVKADRSKWPSESGSGTVTIKSDSKSKSDEECGNDSSSSGGAWGKDGTGKHSLSIPAGFGLTYKPDELPEELKQYAVNPESMGVKYKGTWSGSYDKPNADGWINYTEFEGTIYKGQCTEFAATMLYQVWEKGGQHMVHSANAGDGGVYIINLAPKYNLKISDTPKSGAIFSNADGGHGHVGMVSHVFENGDVLIIEQNIDKKSGMSGGMPNTWNYRLIDKASIKSQMSVGFCYPGDFGYTVNKNAKTIK